MKNRLSDLNDHLFAQLERLSDEDLTPEQIDREHKRGEAIVAVADQIIRNGGEAHGAVADQIIRNAALQVQAAKLVSDHGLDPTPHLPPVLMIEGRRQ